MIKLKKKEVLTINESLTYLSQQKTSAWYPISKNLKLVKPFILDINETKEELIKNLAKIDEEGKVSTKNQNGITVIDWKDEKEATTLWDDILNEEVSIDFYKFGIDKLNDLKLEAVVIEPLLDVCLIEE
jgi:hypothetical protein